MAPALASTGKLAEKLAGKKMAVVLIRGTTRAPHFVCKALEVLNLHRVNHAVVVADTPAIKGMIVKVKDYVTWGEISGDAFTELLDQRGELYRGRLQDRKKKYQYHVLKVNGKLYKPCFRLNPPTKGFGRKGTKVAYTASGGLGYRGEAINDLIRRML